MSDTLTQDTPQKISELLSKVFPTGSIGYISKSNFEINGLGFGTVPKNCVIVADGNISSNNDRRHMYILEVDDYVISLRICSADMESGYAEFATGRVSKSSSEDPAEYLSFRCRGLDALNSLMRVSIL